MGTRVLINILNFNTEQYLAQCVASVRNQTYADIELLITDNKSLPESIAYIQRTFPDVRLRLNEHNVGFGNAHNDVMATEQFDYYMPLNPDVVLGADFVTQLVGAIEADSRIGSANGKIFFLTDAGVHTKVLYSAGHEFDRARRCSNRGYKMPDSGDFDAEAYVFGANGAAALYKRDFLEAVKINGTYFDADFFMYWDDTDIGWRGVLFGFKCLYVPSATAYHHGFGSGGIKKPFIQFQYERNRFLTIYKNDFPEFFVRDVPIFVLHELVNLSFFLVTTPGRVVQYLKAIGSFARMVPRKRRERAEIMARTTINKGELRAFYMNPLFRKLFRRRYPARSTPR